MLTDPDEIRRLAEIHAAEDVEFRRHIHNHHISDQPMRERVAELLADYPCTECANCCRATRVPVDGGEIRAIASHLGMEAARVEQFYTEKGDEPGEVLLRHESGACVFLSGGQCMVYDARPGACRTFPAIALHEGHLGNRMSSVCRQAAICPIVFEALEEFKHLTGFHPKRRAVEPHGG